MRFMPPAGLPIVVGLVLATVPLISCQPNRDALVETPFGKVPRECYAQCPSGTVLSAIAGGLRARRPDGTTTDLLGSARCSAVAQRLKARRARPAVAAPPIYNGWFNYAAWLALQGIGQFYATYTLPQLPAQPGSQELYYYIGLEDGQDPESPILQPVVGYNQGDSGGYFLAAYVVSPSGVLCQSTPVTGMGPGDTVSVSIEQSSTSPSTYLVYGAWQGQSTQLSWVTGSDVQNSPYVTFENYGVTSCSQFLTGPFTFSGLYLADLNNNMLTPQWQVTPAPSCNGQLTWSGDVITIEQNGPSAARGR